MRSALYVASGAALLATICCAFCAFAWWKVSATATRMRSMSSALAELHEIRDYLQKLDAWSKRINSRLAMQSRRESIPDEHARETSQVTSKDTLRRIAGIVPGRPAPHR
jgi:Flp pilus assembly protein TadB